MTAPRIVVLGGGTAGTWVANRLHRARDAAVTVVDGHGNHLFQPGQIRLVFNGDPPESLERDERNLLDPGIALRVARVKTLDADRRRVELESGDAIEYDALVVATGSRLDSDAIPGLRDHADNFHCRAHAITLRERLRAWKGGRIVVGAARLPYKCPPSPHEFSLLLDEWLGERKLREATSITFVYPLPRIFSNDPTADFFESLFKERRIAFEALTIAERVERGRLVASGGRSIDFDLLVMVPPHAGAHFLRGHPLATPEGWVRVDPHTLRAGERVYALGDAAALPVPKSGAAAHFQGATVVANVLADLDGRELEARYDGHVICSIETGRGRATTIDFDYRRPPAPKPPTRKSYFMKQLFSRLYFPLVARARI